jgi:hypothetical protein
MLTRSALVAVVGIFACALPALAVTTPNTRPPEDPTIRWQFTTGIDFATGEYGGSRSTDVITVPFSAKTYFSGDWSVRASIPFLTIHGPANVVIFGEDGIGGPGELGGGGSGERTQTSTGFGDASVIVTKSFNRIGGGPMYIDAKARVRLPTGDEDEGLGVGAWDFGLDAEVGAVWNRRGVYASLGRRFRGDSDFFQRRDGWAMSVGGWMAAGERTDVGAFYDWNEHSLAGFDDRQDIGGYVSYRLTREFKLQGSVVTGLTDSSSDLQVGLLLIYRPGAG